MKSENEPKYDLKVILQAILPGLGYVIDHLQVERERMREQLAALEGKPALRVVSNGKPKRTMSTEGRAKIAEAQRKRWARAKKPAAKKPGGWDAMTPHQRAERVANMMAGRKRAARKRAASA